MGRGKVSPKWGGNRELFRLTPPPPRSKIPPRRRLLPCPLSPSLANSAKGADGETWRRETLDLGRATSPSIPGLPPATHLHSPMCVRGTGPGTGGQDQRNQGRPGPAQAGKWPRSHEGSLVASGRFAAPPPPSSVESAVLQETRPKDSVPASFLSPALSAPLSRLLGRGPQACFLPLRSRREKMLARPGLRNHARDWAGRSCLGERHWDPHTLLSLGRKGDNCDRRGTLAGTSFSGGKWREKQRWREDEAAKG